MRIALIVGSNRKDSINKRIAQFMQQRYVGKLELSMVAIDQLPLYNQDDEMSPAQSVLEMKAQVAASDGILIVTPEHNHTIPTVLKNALDWCSRVEKVMYGKPAFIVGASTGLLGTARAQMHLRQIMNSPGIGALTLPGNEVYIGAVKEKIDANGDIVHEQTVQVLDRTVANFIQWAEQLKR